MKLIADYTIYISSIKKKLQKIRMVEDFSGLPTGVCVDMGKYALCHP